MKPFKQTETGKTETAKTVSAPADSPMYSSTIQQNPVREKINFALAIGASTNGIL